MWRILPEQKQYLANLPDKFKWPIMPESDQILRAGKKKQLANHAGINSNLVKLPNKRQTTHQGPASLHMRTNRQFCSRKFSQHVFGATPKLKSNTINNKTP
jgi:hypothetical protein